MGPYCKFCDRRCFAHFPAKTPDYILRAYGTSTIIATCPGGQAFEKKQIGYCYNDIQAILAAQPVQGMVIPRVGDLWEFRPSATGRHKTRKRVVKVFWRSSRINPALRVPYLTWSHTPKARYIGAMRVRLLFERGGRLIKRAKLDEEVDS